MSESSDLVFLLHKDESNRGIDNRQDLKNALFQQQKEEINILKREKSALKYPMISESKTPSFRENTRQQLKK